MARNARLEVKTGQKQEQEQQQGRRREQEYQNITVHLHSQPSLEHSICGTPQTSGTAESAENSLYRKLLINFIWLKLEEQREQGEQTVITVAKQAQGSCLSGAQQGHE